MSGGGGEGGWGGAAVMVHSGRKWKKMKSKVAGWRMSKEEMKIWELKATCL